MTVELGLVRVPIILPDDSLPSMLKIKEASLPARLWQENLRAFILETSPLSTSTDAELRDRATHTGVQPISSIDGLEAALENKAPVETTVTLTGAQVLSNKTVPALDPADNSLKIANTAFARAVAEAAVAALVDSAPSSLDTLREFAVALGNDPNFATTIINLLAQKRDMATGINRVYVRNGSGVESTLGYSSSSALATSFALRDPNGRLKVSDPVAIDDAVNKRYLETTLADLVVDGGTL